MMRAARMHAAGGPMSIDTIPLPRPGLQNRNGGFSNYVVVP
jgi:D-arabinose 1-dehydrogenase-like Zn-dependent alcohol dehydrogenase